MHNCTCGYYEQAIINEFVNEYWDIQKRDYGSSQTTFGYMFWKTMKNGKTVEQNLVKITENSNVNRSYIARAIGSSSNSIWGTMKNHGYAVKRVYPKRELIPT